MHDQDSRSKQPAMQLRNAGQPSHVAHNSPYTGDYQLRNQVRGAYAWGPGPCAVGAAYYIGRGAIRLAAIPWRFPFP